MDAITTIGLTKDYRGIRAVDNLCLHIPQGSICGFLGRNGAGKTTTIRMLVGLAKPSAGEIFLHGQERIYGKNHNCDIGYLPDVPSFYGCLTAREYLDFCGRLYGMDPKGRNDRIRYILEKVGLKDTKKAIVGYSRGMKQRLGIAQALMNSPETIFLDEPISALDPAGRYEVMELIRSLQGSVTVFFSTHILVDAESTCDYVVIMDRGRVVEAGTLEEIKKRYTGNSARVRFCSPVECRRTIRTLSQYAELSYEKCSDIEIKITGPDMMILAKRIPGLLAESQASIERYESAVPALEQIFMEVTSSEQF